MEQPCSKILSCYNARCVNAFQDREYGKNKRIHNRMVKDTKNHKGWCCTVCGDKKAVA